MSESLQINASERSSELIISKGNKKGVAEEGLSEEKEFADHRRIKKRNRK